MNTVLSTLEHTWLIDLDGTILEHNGHLNKKEVLLPGVIEFWSRIPKTDTIIILSARSESYKATTLKILESYKLWYTIAIFNLPTGERIMINDIKPKGLKTSIAINVERNSGLTKVNFDLIEGI